MATDLSSSSEWSTTDYNNIYCGSSCDCMDASSMICDSSHTVLSSSCYQSVYNSESDLSSIQSNSTHYKTPPCALNSVYYGCSHDEGMSSQHIGSESIVGDSCTLSSVCYDDASDLSSILSNDLTIHDHRCYLDDEFMFSRLPCEGTSITHKDNDDVLSTLPTQCSNQKVNPWLFTISPAETPEDKIDDTLLSFAHTREMIPADSDLTQFMHGPLITCGLIRVQVSKREVFFRKLKKIGKFFKH